MIITTITLNPCLDRREYLTHFEYGATNRPYHTSLSVGGKGINVSKTLLELILKDPDDSATRVDTLTFAGGQSGEIFKELLTKKLSFGETVGGITVIPSRFETRHCLKLVTPSGVTEINEAGSIGADEIKALIDVLADLTVYPENRVVILSGSSPVWQKQNGFSTHVENVESFPQDVEIDVENLLITVLEGCGIPVIVDTSSKGLVESLKASPSMIKPNETELSELFGRPFDGEKELVDFCRELYVDNGCEVLCTRGEKGALFVGKEGVFKRVSHRVFPCDPTGAGDTFLAAFVYGRYVKQLANKECLNFADQVTENFLKNSLKKDKQ